MQNESKNRKKGQEDAQHEQEQEQDDQEQEQDDQEEEEEEEEEQEQEQEQEEQEFRSSEESGALETKNNKVITIPLEEWKPDVRGVGRDERAIGAALTFAKSS